MKRKLAWMLAVGPIFAVAYFLRAGESSFYVFDPYALALILMAIPFVPGRRLMVVVIGCLLFVTISGIGLMATADNYGSTRLDQFVIGSLRYTQLIVVTYVVIMLGRNPGIPVKAYAPALLLVAACFPLVVGIAILQVRPELVLEFNRFSSYLSSPNNVGAFICVVIPTVNYALRLVGSRLRMAFWLIFYGFAAISLFYAGSNSGWLLCAVSFAISVLAVKGRLGRNLLLSGFLVAVLVVSALTLQDWLLSSDINGLRNTGELIATLRYGDQFMDLGSGRLRESLAGDAWNLYLSSPFTMLFGIGLGQSPALVGARYGGNITAHNAFLVLLLETGLLGMIILALLLVNVIRMARAKREAVPIVAGYLLAMQGTPHVYLPFLWASMSFSLYLMCAMRSWAGMGQGR